MKNIRQGERRDRAILMGIRVVRQEWSFLGIMPVGCGKPALLKNFKNDYNIICLFLVLMTKELVTLL